MTVQKLDKFDINILQLLQQDASQSVARLADKVCLSHSQCHRRVKRLEELGYIDKYVALLNRDKLDLSINAIVLVTVHTDTHEAKTRFRKFVGTNDAIQECWTVAGEKYAMLKVVSRNMSAFSRFISNELMSMSNIASSESIMLMESLKTTTSIPVNR